MDDELDAWLFGDPTALLATNNPYADILSQFPEDTNLDDYVVTENGLIRNTAGDTGTFKDGKWIPYTGGDVKTFLTGSSASRFLNFAKRAKDALSSPQGIAGLAGAALGFLDRPKPSGGGTTMAYPGAAKLERKMVQGPYGPLAEYTGVGGGTPDYTRFTAPQVQFPTVGSGGAPSAGAGMSMQAKIDLYKQLRGYGLSDERVRRIAETMFGVQTDSDWSELTRRAGVTTGGIAGQTQKPSTKPAGAKQTIDPNKDYGFTRDPNAVGGMAIVPWYNKKTGQTYRASDTAWQPPSADWVKGEFDAFGNIINPAAKKEPATSKPLVENPATFTGPPSLQVSQSSTPQQKAQEYQRLRQFGMSDSQIRAMAEAQMGKQTDEDWQALLNLAMPSATPTGQQTSGATDTTAEDPFIKSVREATGGGSQSPLYTDPISKSTLAVKKDYLGQPLEFTFTDKYGKSEKVGASNTTPINELAQKYQIGLTKAFGAGTSETGGGLPWYGGLETTVDPKQYANVGAFTPGAPQQMVYSPEDQGLVFQPTVTGKDLGAQIPQMAAKPFADLESTLQKFKQTPPKTQEELVEANSAWLDYQNRFANSRAGYEPGRYDSSLKPVSMLSQTYTGYGPLNEALTNLSQQASSGTAQALTGSPFAGKEAQQLNQTIASVGSNPLVQQTLNKISAIDPTAKFSTDDAVRLAGQIQELGPQYAVANFIRDKQNLIGFGTNEWQSRLNTKDPTYAAYQNLLNNVSDLYSQPRLATGGITQGYAHGGLVHMEDGGFVLNKKAVDGAGGPRGIQQLVPGARMVRGPGTGTSDDIPAVINGPRGQTPARLSNGEAYVPKRFVQAQGGPQRMYALMNNLQRKA